MIGSHLQAYLVEVLHAAGESGILGPSVAKVRDVHEVCHNEDVDADVWVLQACHCDYCVDESSHKENEGVRVLGKAGGANTLIHAAYSLSGLFLGQTVSILVQDVCEIEWNHDHGYQEYCSESRVDFCLM